MEDHVDISSLNVIHSSTLTDLIVVGTTNFDSLYVTNDADICGNLNLTGTLFSDSDRTIKDNLVVLPNTLENIVAIHGYSYTRVDQVDTTKRHIGVIAQEVESIYPELIHENETSEIKSVNYNGLCAVLIQCVKELKEENSMLKQHIQNIEERVAKLESA